MDDPKLSPLKRVQKLIEDSGPISVAAMQGKLKGVSRAALEACLYILYKDREISLDLSRMPWKDDGDIIYTKSAAG